MYQPSERLRCSSEERFPTWNQEDWISEEAGNWTEWDTVIDNTCKLYSTRFAQYMFSGEVEMPTCCETINICNRTHCLVFGPESILYSSQRPKSCAMEDLSENHFLFEDLFVFEDPQDPSYQYFSDTQALNYLRLLPIEPPEDYIVPRIEWSSFKGKKNLVDSTSRLCNKCKKHCKGKERQLIIQGIGRLPQGCEEVNICNSSMCTVFSHTGLFFSRVQSRSTLTYPWLLFAPPACLSTNMNRPRRAAVPAPIADSNRNLETPTLGLLKFNLPGYRYDLNLSLMFMLTQIA